ncbi:MAG: DUF169 domain-containing protein [Candidatus Altiarchaeota archaeon]
MKIKKDNSTLIEELLGLDRGIVGVCLLSKTKYSHVTHGLRFCEAVMKAAEGRNLVVSNSDSLCPASDVVLGIEKPKYAQIKPRVESITRQVILGPISEWMFKEKPQVAILIARPSQAMHIANALGVKPTMTDGEVALCGITVYTILTKNPSTSLLCNSCRLYAGVRDNELSLSFSFTELEGLKSALSKMEGVRRIRLVDFELPPSCRLVHRILSEKGSSTQAELLRASALSERSLRNALKQLAGKGVVSESVDFSDRRRRIYKLI